MYDINRVEDQCAYDQYMQFECLPKLLKRFSFSEKMRICNKYSRQAINFENSRDYDKLQKIPLPWCLETFAMLSLEAYEYSDKDFVGRNEKKFIKMINTIWNYRPEKLNALVGQLTFADYILPVMALTQFYLQESFWIKFYRYWTLFSSNSTPVRLCDTFRSKMGTEYYEYLLLGIYLRLLFSSTASIPSNVIEYLIFNLFPAASANLTISRDDYIHLQHSFVADLTNKTEYIYCVRPSYQFAFIRYNNFTYLPLPHLLTQNITSSLYYRITDGDNRLREEIGKQVLEPYLLRMVEQSGNYDEVYPEQSYKALGGSEAKSPDVLARKGKIVLFLESKSSAPSKGIRLFDEAAYDKNIEITADNIIKLYKQIKFFSRYNPFSDLVSDDINDYWGTLVLLEDSYIRREKYYERVKSKLQINEKSSDWRWLISHIKVASLYEIEKLCYCSCSIIDAIKEQQINGQVFDYQFSKTIGNGVKFTNDRLLSFKQKVSTDLNTITEELIKAGLLYT